MDFLGNVCITRGLFAFCTEFRSFPTKTPKKQNTKNPSKQEKPKQPPPKINYNCYVFILAQQHLAEGKKFVVFLNISSE